MFLLLTAAVLEGHLAKIIELHLPPSSTVSSLSSSYPSTWIEFDFRLPEEGCPAAPGLINSVKFGRELGGGSFGTVFDVFPTSEKAPEGWKTVEVDGGEGNLVVKELLPIHRDRRGHMSPMYFDRWAKLALKEVVVGFKLASLSENFVNLVAAFVYHDGLCLLMEKVEGQDLYDVLDSPSASLNTDLKNEAVSGRLPEHVAREIVFQVLKGLQRSHEVGVELGDIKLENIMLDRPLESFQEFGGLVKVVDFGLSRVSGRMDDIRFFHDSWTRRNGEGTDGYLPPSVSPSQDGVPLTLLPPSGLSREMFHQDVFALGVAALKLLLGDGYWPMYSTEIVDGVEKALFRGVHLKNQKVNEKRTFPSFLVSDECEDFLREALKVGGFVPAAALLQHPWFSLSPEELREQMNGRMIADWPGLSTRIQIYVDGLLPPSSLTQGFRSSKRVELPLEESPLTELSTDVTFISELSEREESTQCSLSRLFGGLLC